MHGLIHGKASHKNKEPRRIVSGSVYCYVLRIHECEKITESLRSFPGIRSCFCASSESTYNSCIIIFIVCGSISGRIISIEWADFYSLSIVLNCIRKSSINRHTHCVYLFISIGWSHVDLYRPNDRYIQIARVNRYFFVSILWLNSFPHFVAVLDVCFFFSFILSTVGLLFRQFAYVIALWWSSYFRTSE